MKYCRTAFLQAAEHIDRFPHTYQFNCGVVPHPAGVGCLLGWIGAYMDLLPGTYNWEVARAIGLTSPLKLYGIMDSIAPGYTEHAPIAAHGLRAFADAYFPAVHDSVREVA